MSYCMPLNSETFYDPVSLVNAPLVQDFAPAMSGPSTFIDYNAFLDYDAFLQDELARSQFCIDAFQTLDEPVAGGHPPSTEFYPEFSHYSTPSPTSMPETHPACMSPPGFTDPVDAWIASQLDDLSSSSASADAGSPASSTSSQSSHGIHVSSDAHPRTARPLKRKADDADYEDDAASSSDSSEYAPRRPAKRPTPARKVVLPPLPDSLQPIRVGSAAFTQCLMPGCTAVLEAKDSAWRGHFKRVHHDMLCLTPGCRSNNSATCKARCPLPESCPGDHAHTHTHAGKKDKGGDASGTMSIESVGRHLLNVHIKVGYRCPSCGLQSEWRHSACVRHIRRCVEKHAMQRKGNMLY